MTDSKSSKDAAQAGPPEAKRIYVFNKETGLYGYTFGDGTKFRVGPTYPLTEAEAKTYAAHTENGHKLLVLKKG